jgi:hypothetical protein
MRVAALLALLGGAIAGAQTGPAKPQSVLVVTDPERASGLYHHVACPLTGGGATLRSYTLAEAQRRHFQPHCQCLVGRDEPPAMCVAELAAVAAQSVASPATGTPATPIPAHAAPTGNPQPRTSVQPATRRCQATTQKGTQCSRNAQPGGSYCWQHAR